MCTCLPCCRVLYTITTSKYHKSTINHHTYTLTQREHHRPSQPPCMPSAAASCALEPEKLLSPHRFHAPWKKKTQKVWKRAFSRDVVLMCSSTVFFYFIFFAFLHFFYKWLYRLLFFCTGASWTKLTSGSESFLYNF